MNTHNYRGTRNPFVAGVAPDPLVAVLELNAYLESRFLPSSETYETIKQRIMRDEVIFTPDDQGNTLLSKALYSKADPEIIRLLLEHGADADQYLEFDDLTVLMVAVKYKNNTDVIQMLIKYGAHVNDISGSNKTALYYACANENPDVNVIKTLVYAGAKVPDGVYRTDYLNYIPYTHPDYPEIFGLLTGEHEKAARVIQKRMKHWLWTPYTRDGKVGLMPARIGRELCDSGFIKN